MYDEYKNWVRLCGILNGFHVRYGHWPTRLRLPRSTFEDLRLYFHPDTFHSLLRRFEAIVDDAYFAAEGDGGRRYDGFRDYSPSLEEPPIPAWKWLRLDPYHQKEPPVIVAGDRADSATDILDLTLAGRRLSWLGFREAAREAVRFFVHDLGFSPAEVESFAGQELWRPLPSLTMCADVGTMSLELRDPHASVTAADVVRTAAGERLVFDDRHDWRAYREVLYRLEATLPFGTVMWRRSRLMARQMILDRLELGAGVPGSGVRRRYEPPMPGRDRPIPNCYWVSSERLLAGEYPFALDPAAGHVKLERLLDLGVGAFIDVTGRHEGLTKYAPQPGNTTERGPVEHHWHPIAPGAVPDDELMSTILDTIDDALDRGLLVYVHDRGGLGRSAMVIGCHLTRRGMSGEDALEVVSRLVRVMPRARSRPAPETNEQQALVRSWPGRDPRRARARGA